MPKFTIAVLDQAASRSQELNPGLQWGRVPGAGVVTHCPGCRLAGGGARAEPGAPEVQAYRPHQWHRSGCVQYPALSLNIGKQLGISPLPFSL